MIEGYIETKSISVTSIALIRCRCLSAPRVERDTGETGDLQRAFQTVIVGQKGVLAIDMPAGTSGAPRKYICGSEMSAL